MGFLSCLKSNNYNVGFAKRKLELSVSNEVEATLLSIRYGLLEWFRQQLCLSETVGLDVAKDGDDDDIFSVIMRNEEYFDR